MKSHLATHGFGPWRCTGCPLIGLRKSTIQTYHRASGETGVAGYFDPALNDRIYLEVRECRLPHSSPWTGLTPAPQPDATALTAARATIVSQDANVPYARAPTATVASKAVNYLNITDEEAQALDREVDWSSDSLTSLETSPSPPSPIADPAFITQAVNIALTFADTMNEVEQGDTNYPQVQTWIGLLRHHANCIQGAQTVEDVDGDMELMVGFMQLYCNILEGTPEEIDALNNKVNDMERLRRTIRGE
ncbi:hypothetical protein KCU83_g4897, partial [Aureobasidium melanogenum]